MTATLAHLGGQFVRFVLGLLLVVATVALILAFAVLGLVCLPFVVASEVLAMLAGRGGGTDGRDVDSGGDAFFAYYEVEAVEPGETSRDGLRVYREEEVA